MRIGEFARRAGVSTRALRYYEKQGLLSTRRAANGYREYEESDLRLVAEIRTLLAAGFTLEDARPFVDCLRAGNEVGSACPEAVVVSRRKLAEIDAEIRLLLRRRAEITGQLAQACPGCVLSPEDGDGSADLGESPLVDTPRRVVAATHTKPHDQ